MNRKPLFGAALVGAATLATLSSTGIVSAEENADLETTDISTVSTENGQDAGQQVSGQETAASENQNAIAEAEADVAEAQANVTEAEETNQAIAAADQAVESAKTQLDQESPKLETEISENNTAVAQANEELQEAIQADTERQADIDDKQAEVDAKQAELDALKKQLGSNSSTAEIIATHDMEQVFDGIYNDQEQDGYTTARLNGSGEHETVTIVADPNAYSFNELNYDTYLRQYIQNVRLANGINTSVPSRSDSAKADTWAQARAEEEIAEDDGADHETALNFNDYFSPYPNGANWSHSSEDVSVTSEDGFTVGSDQELAYYIVMRYLTEYLNISGTASDMTADNKVIFDHAISILGSLADQFGVGAAVDTASDGNDYFDTVLEFILFDNNETGSTLDYINNRFTVSQNADGQYVLNFDGKAVTGLPYTTFQYVTENYATYLALENQIAAVQAELETAQNLLAAAQAVPTKIEAAQAKVDEVQAKLSASQVRLQALKDALTDAQSRRAALPTDKMDVASLQAILAEAQTNLQYKLSLLAAEQTDLDTAGSLRPSNYQENDPQTITVPVSYNTSSGNGSENSLPDTGDDGYLAGIAGFGLLLMVLGSFAKKNNFHTC